MWLMDSRVNDIICQNSLNMFSFKQTIKDPVWMRILTPSYKYTFKMNEKETTNC